MTGLSTEALVPGLPYSFLLEPLQRLADLEDNLILFFVPR